MNSTDAAAGGSPSDDRVPEAVARVVVDAHELDFLTAPAPDPPEAPDAESPDAESPDADAPDAEAPGADAPASVLEPGTYAMGDADTEAGFDAATGRPAPGYGPRAIDRHGALAALGATAKQIVSELEQSGELTVDALATAVGAHPNTVRSHLDDLLTLGLVRRRPRRNGGRGRPQWLYGPIQPGADSVALVRLLAGHIQSTEDPEGLARSIGREYDAFADAPHQPGDGDPVEVLTDALTELGFGAERDDVDAGTVDYLRLRTCPILELATEQPDVICGLHSGMIERLWADLGGAPGEPDLQPFAGKGWCGVTVPRSAKRPSGRRARRPAGGRRPDAS